MPVTDAGRFAGRHEQLQAGVTLLRQAGTGNPRHALVTGPRGIGKTSLVAAIRAIAEGNHGYLDLVGIPPDSRPATFVTAAITATPEQSHADVAHGLMHELRRRTHEVVGVAIEEAEINALFAKVRVKRSTELTHDVVVALVDAVDRVWSEVRQSEAGILLIIDELDQVADAAQIGPFLKAFVEQLAARGITNVMLLCAGPAGVMEQLRAGHGSAPRVFQPIDLPPLTAGEGDDLLRSSLLGTRIGIDDDASTFIAEFTRGTPDLIQAVAYEAYERTDDGGAITLPTATAAWDKVRSSGVFDFPEHS